ncbi:hypothetical protein LCGC14_1233110, partial [marine sediment metagenome]
MTYHIKNSRGTILTTIEDRAVDLTSTSLVLHGRGASPYGTRRNENLVHLLENFSSGSPPSNPIDGQLWWDTTDLRVWDTTGSPDSWELVFPATTGLGFSVGAGDGLTGGGFPSGSPDPSVTLNIGLGTGISSGVPGGDISYFMSENITAQVLGSGPGSPLLGSPLPALGEWINLQNAEIPGASLNGNTNYLIIWHAGASSSGNFANISLRLFEDTVGALPSTTNFYESDGPTAGAPGIQYFIVTRVTTANTPNTYRLQASVNTSPDTMTVHHTQNFAIDLDALGAPGGFYNELFGSPPLSRPYMWSPASAVRIGEQQWFDTGAEITIGDGSSDYIVFMNNPETEGDFTDRTYGAIQIGPSGSPAYLKGSPLMPVPFGSPPAWPPFIGSPEGSPLTNIITTPLERIPPWFRTIYEKEGEDRGSSQYGGATLIEAPAAGTTIKTLWALKATRVNPTAHPVLVGSRIAAIRLQHFSDSMSTRDNTIHDQSPHTIDTTKTTSTGGTWLGFGSHLFRRFAANHPLIILQTNENPPAGSPELNFGSPIGGPYHIASHGTFDRSNMITWGQDVGVATGVTYTIRNNIGNATAGNPASSMDRFVAGFTVALPARGSPSVIATDDAAIDHDALLNFVANEHIDHSSVSLTAGAGLTGGGDLLGTQIFGDWGIVLSVGAGDGIDVTTPTPDSINVDSTVVLLGGGIQNVGL